MPSRLILILVLCSAFLFADESEAVQLARSLVSAEDNAARNELVAAHPEVIPLDLRQAMIAEIRILYNRALYARALAMADYLERYSALHQDLAGMAHAHLFSGNVKTQMGDYEQAAAEYHQCLSLATEAGYTLGQYGAATATGILAQLRGNYRESIESHQRALEIAEASGNQDWIATVLVNLGVSYNEVGDKRRSLESYERVYQLKPGDPEWEPYVLANLAGLYSGQGDASIGLEYSRRAWRILEAQGLERESISALNNMGESLRVLGRFREAVESFERTLSQSEKLGVKKGVALAWLNLGRTYELQGKSAAARAACQNGLRLRNELGDKPGEVESLLCLSRLSLTAKQFRPALESGLKAVKIARLTQSSSLLWEPLLITGRAQQALGLPAARSSYEESIAVIESLRDQVVGDERQRQQFFEDKVLPYYALADLMAAQGRTEAALQYAERARSRVLQDVFSRDPSIGAARVPSAERAEEQRLILKLADSNRQVLRGAGDRLPALQIRLQEARTALEMFRNRLYARYPELKYVRADTGPITRGQIQQLLTDPRGALLEFVLGETVRRFLSILPGSFGRTP